MDSKELQELNAQNREMEEKLTNKNAEYILKLKKHLDVNGVSESVKVQKLNGMLMEIVEKQKSGVTARQLFGTVSEQVDEVTGRGIESLGSKVAENTAPHLMILDNFLLMLAVFGIVSGILGFFSNGYSPYGLLTVFLMCLGGATFFYMMYYFIYQYERPGADKSMKPKRSKSLPLMVGFCLIWFVLFSLTAFLPAGVNPLPEGWVMIALGAAAAALRIYMKRKFNIASAMQSQRPQAPRKR